MSASEPAANCSTAASFVFVLYLISYIDRANVSFANFRMSADLGFRDRAYVFGVGLFFLGWFSRYRVR